ncbi:hypothetical protein N7539_005457 [Penicillium diatomitis]|uniref:Uncharacterized protein n=1 Tax=Penicillium diatomitis TaxID=2819901 RepID=A0A9W9X6V9_9EURO|nr:uncharacterized protein N7539_005457 [Penicillium diatomitis]KAJ5485469.1 hypothetical protein N7539_005457 [Penicillium diatomitis]
MLSKMLGAGLGMASEAIHSSKSRSRSRSQSGQALDDQPIEASCSSAGPSFGHQTTTSVGESYDDSDSESEELRTLAQDEAAWELDDMATQLSPPTYNESQAAAAEESESVKIKKEEEIVRQLVRKAGPPPHPPRRLPCPVILPQRRPRDKSRGFVRAYAPVLADCGISQEVFLEYLESWDKASKASSWLEVVFVASSIVGFVPEVAAQVTGLVLQVVSGVAREMQSRSRRNTFLDRVNQDLFMPRGLFALVMAFRDKDPSQSSAPIYGLTSSLGKKLFTTEKMDINQTVAKYSNPDPEMSKLQKGLRDVRVTNGEIEQQIELPEAAELVFPDLDKVAEAALTGDDDLQKKKPGTLDRFKDAGNWVQDYMDRRSQAFYEAEHRGSSLAVAAEHREPLKSRYNDPTHPANSGSLIALLTGGAVNPTPRREARREARQVRRNVVREDKDAQRVARGRAPRGPRKVKSRGSRKTIFKKILIRDVLYLTIVNVPTEEELQQSAAQLDHILREQESLQ